MKMTEGMAWTLIIGCSLGIAVWVIGLIASLQWAYAS